MQRQPDDLRVDTVPGSTAGASVVFFSGGTALDGVSRVLKLRTRRSVHVLTPFDSGGSTAELRRVFRMPAVGDLRSRLTALADERVPGTAELCALFSHRFTPGVRREEAHQELLAMAAGAHPLVAAIPEPLRSEARGLVIAFVAVMPADFDPSLACVGNLMMTAAYLQQGASMGAAVAAVARLLAPLGTVVLSAEADCELGARLADGTLLVGQHRLTGRSEPPIASPVVELFLVDATDGIRRTRVAADERVTKLVERAGLICYPVGSFYSSLVANLLPSGMGAAITRATCPKVYIPNMGRDPEQAGMTVGRAVEQLVEHVRRDAGEAAPAGRVVSRVLLDVSDDAYAAPLDLSRVRSLGIEVDRRPLREQGAEEPRIDSNLACEAILELLMSTPCAATVR